MNDDSAFAVTGDDVTLDGERYLRITNVDRMPEFMMSIVGADDHWMFISSRGALTAGRRNADNALFPYAADDQLSARRDETGPLTLIRIDRGNSAEPQLWQPLADDLRGTPAVQRNLYKNPLGTKVVFEEVQRTFALTFRYRWTFSQRFGFVRSCVLRNDGEQPVSLEVLDGLRNVLPFGVSSEFMMRFSNLATAYRKSELIDESNMGLFLLSSIPTDRAEPSESLRTTTVWQTGWPGDAVLLSETQVDTFRRKGTVQTERDVRGRKGAYLVRGSFQLPPAAETRWHQIAELRQDHADVIAMSRWIAQEPCPADPIEADVAESERAFVRILASADGLQCTKNLRRIDRHRSNTAFNVMRGGIPIDGYNVPTRDFAAHVHHFNHSVAERHASVLDSLPAKMLASELVACMSATGDPDLRRLSLEYLPLSFSRRHGDPTRPWNHFSIDLKTGDGEPSLNYQGNWRDIFQNWEALAISFPKFTPAMVARFVNATTADGYNPYRVTKDGFDWEQPEPDDPWANIGYWGDHQIVYLLKLLQWNQRVDPEALTPLLNERVFVHADVPYRIASFEAMKRDPTSTIDFDHQHNRVIARRIETVGADGKLVHDSTGEIHRVSLIEKLLILSLAKLSNLVPGGGIWLNTQRPEWNDANNALVGNGLSMVTACYLYRWFDFLGQWLATAAEDSFEVTSEVAGFAERVFEILITADPETASRDKSVRGEVVAALSTVGSDYRDAWYANGCGQTRNRLARDTMIRWFEVAKRHLRVTIEQNRRSDGLFHSYNLMRWVGDELEVDRLDEMLEGQVAALSSGCLSPRQANGLLTSLRNSALYREDQNSYLLYPNRQLPRFLDKNRLDDEAVAGCPLLMRLLDSGNRQIVRRDVDGGVHFSGDLRNSAELREALSQLPSKFAADVAEQADAIASIFEETFDHRRFTGRSGTFFGYEGLGSIYWHMVSKLGLAACENFFAAVEANADDAVVASLRSHYEAIRAGIGAEKSPVQYGAFSSDPYSHTPENAGVKQPGMTGQVKEDLLARFAELGVHVVGGRLRFRLDLLDRDELLAEPAGFSVHPKGGGVEVVQVPSGGLAYTLCQVPLVCQAADEDHLEIVFDDGTTRRVEGLALDQKTSSRVFSRDPAIVRLNCRSRQLRNRKA